VKGKGKQRGKNAPPDVPPPVPSEADPSSSGITFPIGPCCLGVNCVVLIWSLGTTTHYVKGGFIYHVQLSASF